MSPRGKWLVSSGLAAVVAAAAFWAGYWRWPVGSVALTIQTPEKFVLDEPTTLVLSTNQPYERTKRRGVIARLASEYLEVKGTRLGQDGDLAKFEIDVVPRHVVCEADLAPELCLGTNVYPCDSLKATVAMPLFYADEEQTFMEIISAPDASIYGSHITVWNTFGGADVLVVTGHAVSGVCRVASSALMGLARHTDIDSEHFFLGAGTGSLDVRGLVEKADDSYERLQSEFSAIFVLLREAEESEIGILERFGFGADLESHLDSRVRARLEDLAAAIAEADSDALASDRDLLAEVVEILRDIGSSTEEGAQLSEHSVELISALLGDSERVIAALQQIGVSDLDPCLDEWRTWPDERRRQFARDLDEVLEQYKAIETASTDLTELANRTGLVRINDGLNSTMDEAQTYETIVANVAKWARDAAPGSSMPLTALASGHRGCMLLPFFDRDGEKISLQLDDATLSSGQDASWREMMCSASAREVGLGARRVAKRLDENYADTVESLARMQAEASNTGMREWLAVKRMVTVTEVDDRGRVIGRRQEEQTHLQSLLSAWDFAASTKQSRRFYERLADSALGMEEDETFQRISDACVIDSLLRGWKLAFADDESQRSFEQWSGHARNETWESLWRQLVEKGIDPRRLISEAVVFQVRWQGNGMQIVPLFVADLTHVRCRKAENGSLCDYTLPWLEREPEFVVTAASSSRESVRTPKAFAIEKLKALDAAIAKTAESIHEVADQSLRLQKLLKSEELVNGQFTDEVNLALSAAPEAGVSYLIDALLTAWPEQGDLNLTAEQNKDLMQLMRYEAATSDGDINDEWAYLGDDLLNGAWPFVDEYLRFALIWKDELATLEGDGSEGGQSEAESEASDTQTPEKREALIADMRKMINLLLKHGRERDEPFIDAGIEADAYTSRSALLTEILRKHRAVSAERGLTTVLSIASLTSEAARALEERDDTVSVAFRADAFTTELEDQVEAAESTEQRETDATWREFLAVSAAPIQQLGACFSGDRLSPDSVGAMQSALQEIAANADAYLEASGDQRLWRVRFRARHLAELTKRSFALTRESDGARLRVIAALDATIEAINQATDVDWSKEEAEAQSQSFSKLRDRIRDDPDYDALARQAFRHELEELVEPLLVKAISQVAKLSEDYPSRRSLEMSAQLQWSGGDYQAAINEVTSSVLAALVSRALEQEGGATEESIEEALIENEGVDPVAVIVAASNDEPLTNAYLRCQIVAATKLAILKACVYSGEEFFGASLFGRRINDWARQPSSLSEVVASMRYRSGGRRRLQNARGATEAYRSALSREAGGQEALTAKIGDYQVLGVSKSFTDTRVFRVLDPDGGEAMLKVRPLGPRQTAKDLVLEVERADWMRRAGINVAAPLPVRPGRDPFVMVEEGYGVTKESIAPGQQLSEIIRSHGGQEPVEIQAAVDSFTMDMAWRGRGMPAELGGRAPVTTEAAMRQKLMERASLGEENFNLFAESNYYREKFGDSIKARRDGFFVAYRNFVNRLWTRGDKKLTQIALVHDAHPGNYFVDGKRVTAIDIGDDYVGHVGNLIAERARVDASRTYEEFQLRTNQLIEAWEAKAGRPLDPMERLEVAQHLAFQPYKNASSDSRMFIAGLKRKFGLPESADAAALRDALKAPENQQAIDELLRSPELQQRFDAQMQQTEHSLRFLEQHLESIEELPGRDVPEALKATRELREAVESVRTDQLRISKNLREQPDLRGAA